jgi:hypothetical protein
VIVDGKRTIRGLSLLLVLSAMGWGFVPVPFSENGRMEERALTCYRKSTAVQFDYSSPLPKDTGRKLSNKVISTPLTLIRELTYWPLSSDSIRDLVLFGDTSPNASRIYTSSDGVTFTKIADNRDAPFATYAAEVGVEEVTFYGTRCLDNGWYLLSVGAGYIWDGNPAHPVGRLFLNKNDGSGWIPVLDMMYGYVRVFGWNGVDGPNICIGEYGTNTNGVSENPRNIYVSFDYGQTWTTAYAPDPVNRRHCHSVVWGNSAHTRIYVACGDADGVTDNGRLFYRLDYADGTWTPTTITTSAQFTCLLPTSDFSYIYGTYDGGAIGPLEKFDTATELFYAGAKTTLVKSPQLSGTNPSCYEFPDSNAYFYQITKQNGLYFTGASWYTGNHDKYGVYVSPDGDHWACILRRNLSMSGYGFYYFASTSQYLFVGKLDASANKCEQYNFPSVRLVDGEYTSPAVNNLAAGTGDGSFETPGHHFTGTNNIVALDRSTTEALHGSYSLRATYNSASTNYGYVYGPKIFADLGYRPQAGDYITMRAFVKCAPNWPKLAADYSAPGIGCVVNLLNVTEGNQVTTKNNIGQPDLSRDWFQINVSAKINTTFNGSTDDLRMRIQISDSSNPVGDYYFYIDCVEYIVNREVLFADKPYDDGNTAPEIKMDSAVGAGGEWTITGIWRPMTSEKSIMVNTHNLKICTITDINDGYLNFYWDTLTSKFVLSDGTTEISHAANTYTPWFQDIIAFAIVGDSDGSMVYVHDTLNGLYTIGDGSTVPLVSEPALLKLGTNHLNEVDTGMFANIRIFNSKLSQSEIIDAFNSVKDIKPPMLGELAPTEDCAEPLFMDSNKDCKVDLVDFSEFALEWLQCGLLNQEHCWQ